jgi:hypothetical protein
MPTQTRISSPPVVASSAPASSEAPPSSLAPAVSSPPAVVPTDTVVVGGSSAEALSVAASRALVTSATGVVVAKSADAAVVADAAGQAERAGVPLLLDDGVASGGVAGGDVSKEIARLGCTTVLVVGAMPAGLVSGGGVAVSSDPTTLSVAQRATTSDVTVLVHSNGGAVTQAESAAATASARAAGATVVAVHGSDPRADPQAIASLQVRPPDQLVAVGADFGSAELVRDRVDIAAGGDELPGGGQIFFPGRRLIALYGHPDAPALGVLGAQDLDDSVTRARQLAASYAPLSAVPVVPTFEIIATVAQKAAGSDGDYSGESSVASLLPWVQKAAASGMYVVLDLQPGRADLLAQAKLYTSLLELPDVGLAVDPEWALAPGQQPLAQIGSISAAKINAVADWLNALTAAHHLPQKLLVLHQFRLSMIGAESTLKTSYDNLALLIHMDGQGAPVNKVATWNAVTRTAPKGFAFGWKNFYKEDHPMLTPAQTMAQKPTPVMISYQ